MTLSPNDIAALLPECASIDIAAPDPNVRLDFPKIPAKMAVYLLIDTNHHPMLLATVGNLRAALQRRIGEPVTQTSQEPPAATATDAPENPAPLQHSSFSVQHSSTTPRIPYGQLCPRVHFRIVHSPFAANWYYYQAARQFFPDTYREMLSWRSPSFITVNPADPHPRFRRTEDLSDLPFPPLTYLGPLPDRRSADQLIQNLEDLFDLCRYHHILIQSPYGKPCAYKEMGKCPAPCDGSVSRDHYHTQILNALAYLTIPQEGAQKGATGLGSSQTRASADSVTKMFPLPRSGYQCWRHQLEKQMTQSAAELNFERAAKLKSQLARGALLEHSAYAHMDNLKNFSYLSLQPGPGKPWVQPFFIHGGIITPFDPVKRKDLPQAAALWLEKCRQLTVTPIPIPLTPEATEQIALVAHHLFRTPDDAGLYLPVHQIVDADSILHAATELLDRKNPPKPIAEQSSDQNQTAPLTTPPESTGNSDAPVI